MNQVGFTERGDWNVTNDFELRRGVWHVHDWIVAENESFILHLVEGRILRPSCAETQQFLESTDVRVMAQGNAVMERRAFQITVFDPVLAARVDAMEQMLAHLMKVESGEAEAEHEQRLRDSLIRLGWKPSTLADPRRLSPPVLVRDGERFQVQISTRKEAPDIDVAWALTLRGHRSRQVL